MATETRQTNDAQTDDRCKEVREGKKRASDRE